MTVSTLFDGSDDRIESSTGADYTWAGFTAMYVCHPDTMAGFDTVYSDQNGGAGGFVLGWSGTAPYMEVVAGNTRTGAAQSYSGWYCVIWTKPTGTAQIRSHIFDGQSWVHANVGGTSANPTNAISSLELGRYDVGASDLFDGDLALVGIWAEDTTDGNCEALLDYDTVAAKGNVQFLTGTSLLNGGTMADSGNGNSETARTGATTGVRHLPGWFLDFDDDGFANASQWRANGVATGTLSLTPPLGTVSGDLLIAAGTVDTSSTLSNSTGWTEIQNTANGSAIRHVVWGRIADGGANDTLVMTQGTAGSDISGVVVRVTDHGVTTVATDVLSGTPATNTSATPNPPTTGTIASNDWLIIVTFGSDDDDDQANWTPPSYSGIRQIQSASSTTSTLTGMAFRKITGTSEDPGVFNMAASEEWVSNTLAIPPASSGTVFEESFAGTATPVGALVKTMAKVPAGTATPAGVIVKTTSKFPAGTITPAGALVKDTSKQLAGSVTPTGALTTARTIGLAVAGSITPAGALVKSTLKNLTGTVTPTGALVKDTSKVLAGTVTPTGALEALLVIFRTFTGSITPSGSLVNSTAKALAGSVTPTGALVKDTSKVLAGSVTPTGAFSAIRAFLRTFAGTITPAGALVKSTSQNLAGTVTPDGAIVKDTSKVLAGTVTPSGAAAFLVVILRTFAGSISPAGALAKLTGKMTTGELGPAGALAKSTSTTMAGSVTPFGAIAKTATKQLAGTITPAGTLIRSALKALVGLITPSGTLSRSHTTPAGQPLVVSIGGSYNPTTTITGSYGTPASAQGSNVLILSAQGSYNPTGSLAGSYTPTTEA